MNQNFAGTKRQAHFKSLKTSKDRNFVRKYNTFSTQVMRYNDLPGSREIELPALDDVKTYPIEHRFWDIGSLTHPDEPWAVDEATKDGIDAYLKRSRCREELGRIAREAYQMIEWAILMETRVEALDVTVSSNSK